MNLRLAPFAVISLIAMLPLSAQEPKVDPTVAQLLPEPAQPAEPPLGPFKDRKERHSYGLGTFLGGREKQNAQNNPDKKTVTVDELIAGLKDGLAGAKSIDYSAGLAMAAQIKRSGVEFDPTVLEAAVRDAAEGKTAKIQPADVQTIMQEIQTGIQARQQAKAAAEGEKNLAASTAWLAENAKKEGVKTTPSGLQYAMDKNGEGRTPGARDIVTVNLVGTGAVDGAEFDRTAEGTPGRRNMMALPKGLQEGLLLMKAGGKARFWLPPALGFGESPRGAALKAHSALAYTVELISSEEPPVNQAATATPGGPGQAPPQLKREPITAVTPPVSVEIPADGSAPKIKIEGQPDAPKAPPAAPAPQEKPAEKK